MTRTWNRTEDTGLLGHSGSVDDLVARMRTAKWLASSVLVVLLVRALVLVQARPTLHQEGEQRILSREKRFSMNEYLVLALSVFNVFVFLYNNIETFFPAALTKTSPEPAPALVSTYNFQSTQQPQQQQQQQLQQHQP